MEKLEILLISTACAVSRPIMEYGGVEQVVRDVAEVLNKDGHQVTVAAPYGSEFLEGINHFPTVKLPQEVWREDIAFNKLVQQKLIPNGFSILHDFSHQHLGGRVSHGYWAQPHPFLFMLWHTPFINGLPNRISEPVYNLCAVGKWQAKHLSQIYNQEVKHVWLGIDMERYALQNEKSERYLWLATPNKNKGGVEAIEICRELDLELDCVGGQIPNQPQSYASQMKNLCDGRQIRWVGGVSEEEKIRYLQNAKAVVFPALQEEAFSLVIIEALATGTPTFTLDVGGLNEILGYEDEYGVISPNLINLKAALEAYDEGENVFEPELLRKRAVAEFSRERMVERFYELYKLILEKDFWF